MALLGIFQNLSGTPDNLLKEVKKQGEAVAREAISELGGGSPKSAETPPQAPDAREQTIQELQGVYGGHEAIMKPAEYAASSASNAQHEETRIPGIFEQLGIKPKEPLIPPEKQAEAQRQHQQYVVTTFETAPKQPSPQPAENKPTEGESARNRANSLSEQGEVGPPGPSKRRKKAPGRMAVHRAARRAESGASQNSIG